MSVYTNGELSYGVVFDEDYKFPWSEDDINGWWIGESGWPGTGFEPFIDGGYAPGVMESDPRTDAWFDSRLAWLKDHPLPVEVVNYQSSEFPAYLLAVPGTVRTAPGGYPKGIDPTDLTVPPRAMEAFSDFIVKYDLRHEGGPGWWLTSYWG